MIEALPIELQEQVVEHLREYIADLQDEQQWDASFNRTQSALVEAAQRAKKERTEGKSQLLNLPGD